MEFLNDLHKSNMTEIVHVKLENLTISANL